ncbi:MAG TPA: thioredoxin domain-containing protein, partial [Sulfurovum sp.]|nr:thioredoxin domain-containing protein [Sulfurovum sp.]
MKKIIVLLLVFHALYAEHKFTNALVNESSLYLKQHAHNPVNWYPWGEEALEKAKKENKLIFLSIGYSTCHWCHVMREESFEDEAIAAMLNEDYISIKVDREELPQIDKKYQKLYMDMQGKRGGWPLNVFLTATLEPIHIAIYIPATKGYGSLGMMDMLPAFSKSYRENPKEIAKLVLSYKNVKKKNKSLEQNLTIGIISKVMMEIENSFDTKWAGFATRPKFPEASKIELLINIYKLNGDKKALQMAKSTLKAMAEGGIYDQIEGGFFWYTTDERWHIPHFEKMLYTNAELIPQYVSMYEITKNPLYKKVVTQTIEH